MIAEMRVTAPSERWEATTKHSFLAKYAPLVNPYTALCHPVRESDSAPNR